MFNEWNELYDNFDFKVRENEENDNFVDITWGAKLGNTTITVPIERIRELASLIDDFLYDIEDDYEFGDTVVCGNCGDYYCTCCGCDCLMEDVD